MQLTSRSQNIDDARIQSSKRFDSLDMQTQGILEAITNSKENLSHDLFEFLTRLICRSEAANRDEHHETRQMIADLRQSCQSWSSTDSITAEIEMLSVGYEEEQLLRRTVQKSVLELLHYPNMTDRYEHLVEAHPQTFDWIFCNADEWQFPWTDFGKWLRDGQGIYWINGKPASGKSTLMKHIYDDRRTQDYLQQWSRKKAAGTVPFCLATFFFWSTGTVTQKSQDGLLRSLLFQVLGQQPELIPLIFPVRWAQLYSGKLSLGQEVHPDPWSSRQLHDALERLIRQTQYPLNICFCIDGLDEFNGDAEQLCIFFKRLSAMSDNLKICVSSRPWVTFKHNFEGGASLRLQDLSANDISTYVNDKLKASVAFTQLAARDKDLASKLTNEIVARAEGVFLWVKVVIRLLLQGVNNRDTIVELWARLQSFPTELNGLYESILSKIEPIYFDWASKAFQYIVASGQLSYDPFRTSTLSEGMNMPSGPVKIPNGVGSLTLIELSFATQTDYDLDDANTMTADQLISKFQEILLHLTARCADLLEVSNSRNLNGLSASFQVVHWMHRTAHDFVLGYTKWTTIIKDDCFRDPAVCFSLMKANLRSLKQLGSMNSTISKPLLRAKEAALFTNSIIYAHYADGHLPTRTIRSKLLAVLKNVVVLPENTPVPLDLVREGTFYGLSDFVEDMLSKQDRPTRQASAKELLRRLCSPERFSSLQYPHPTRKMLNCLIKMGDFAPRRLSDVIDVKFPAVVGGTALEFTNDPLSNRNFDSSQPSLFVESHFSIIDTFLKAGVDPTDSLAYLPKNFVLPLRAMKETVEKSVRPILSITYLLRQIKLALMDEAHRQTIDNQRQIINAHRQTIDAALAESRKRRTVHSQEIELSDLSSENVVFVEERAVGHEKRIKIGQDDRDQHSE
jgi:hypothetical protein